MSTIIGPWAYKAIITDAYDGDTITCDIDLGLGVWLREQRIRLFGIDAPEVRGEDRPEGLISRDWLREQLLNKEVILKTIKDRKGKYGRWLGLIYLSDESRSFNDEMVEAGHAIPWEY